MHTKFLMGKTSKQLLILAQGLWKLGCVLMVNGRGCYSLSSCDVSDAKTAVFFKRRLTLLLFFPLGKFRHGRIILDRIFK